jgi:hypothetical protein
MCAGYLFQPDKQYDVSYDTGDKAIQCGRHVDIFKFWLMWKAKVWRGNPGSRELWLAWELWLARELWLAWELWLARELWPARAG